MVNSLPDSVKSGSVLFGIACAAVGLNLSVMSLGVESTPTEVAATVSATTGEPEVRQVVVDVPVPAPASVTDTPASIPSGQAAALPAPAAPLAQAPVVQPAAPPSIAATAPPAPPSTATAPNPTTGSTFPPSTAAPTTTPVVTTVPTTAAPIPTTSAVTTEFLTYQFDGVATIVIAFHDGQALEFWSATPEPGWGYMVEKSESDEVELKFRRTSGGEGEAKFELTNKNGELKVKKER